MISRPAAYVLLALVLPWVTTGCTDDAFGCLEAEQCGENGQCESNGYCSFPDPSCASGRRFAENATAGVANVCVPTSSSTGAQGSTTASTPGSSSSTGLASSSGTLESTGTDGAQTTTGEGGSSSSGVGASGGQNTSGTTGDSTSTGTRSSESTAQQVDCIEDNESDCVGCFDCVSEQACAEPADVCSGLPGCPEISSCLAQCEGSGLCFDDCCDGHSSTAIEAAQALSACRRDNCGSVHCPRFATPTCSGN